jgi:hypothetical protein
MSSLAPPLVSQYRAPRERGGTAAGRRRFDAHAASRERLDSSRQRILGLAAGSGPPGYRDGTTNASRDAGHRLPFVNRTLFAGVPIPPLEVEIAA